MYTFFRNALPLAMSLALAFAALSLVGCGQRGPVELAIQPVAGDHNWLLSTLTVPPGRQVRVTLTNPNTSEDTSFVYNWVLLDERATDDARDELIADIGGTAGSAESIEAHDQVLATHPGVLAFTKMVKPGETVEVTFTAPPVGSYAYICTAGGHFVTMRGTLKVAQ